VSADETPTIVELIATLKMDENQAHRAILSNGPFCSAVLHFPWVYVQTRGNRSTDAAKLLVFRLPNTDAEDESADDAAATGEDDASAKEKEAKKPKSFSEVRKKEDGTTVEETRLSTKEGVTHTVRSYNATMTADGAEHVSEHTEVLELHDPDAESIELPPMAPPHLWSGRTRKPSRNEILGEPNAKEEKSDALTPLKVVEDIGDGRNLMRWDKFLVCTRGGALEVYSLKDPKKPACLSRCEPKSKKSYSIAAIVRAGTRAFAIGDRVLLCYDLADPAKPKCLGEKATAYDGCSACVAAGRLYLGGTRTKDAGGSAGVAVFDIANPADPKDVYFLPMTGRVYQLFALPGDQLLASLEGDSPQDAASPKKPAVCGSSAFLDLSKPERPALAKEIRQSGGRISSLLSTKRGEFFVCGGMVFLVHGQRLRQMYPFDMPENKLEAFPYHGDSDGEYVALPLDDSAVVIRIY
jgi:hypothetical protein